MLFIVIIIRVITISPTQSDFQKVSVKKEEQKTIGKIIADARKKSGLSLRVVADRIGINFSYLAEIEKDRNNPSERVLKALSEQQELNLDFDELMAHGCKFGEESEIYLKNHPSVGKVVRNIARRNLSDHDLESLNDVVNKLKP